MGDSRVPDNERVRDSLRVVYRILPFFVLFLLVVPCFSENVSTHEGTETILSVATWGTDQASPALWEELVVWTTLYPDSEDPSLYYSEIVLYNSTSGIESRIPATRGYSDMPDIWEDRIVYQTWEENGSEIHLFNISTSEELQLTHDTVNQVKPGIWGDWIVWQEGDDWETDNGVSLYDMRTGNITRVGSSPSAKSPDIWEDRVVWDEYTTGDGNFDIFFYNITTGNITQVTTDPLAQISPSVWGDRIVWLDNRDVSSQIYLFDIASGNETRITEGDFYRESPVVSGDDVVYVNDTVVSLVTLPQVSEVRVSTDMTQSSKGHPSIWGNRTVWSDMRSGDIDIYLYTNGVSMPPLIADFSANKTQGMPPLAVAFNDSTTGQVEGWLWDFGDGGSSDEQSPVHIYDTEGSYSVILTVHNPWQRDAVRKSDLISVGSMPVPGFSQNLTSGPAPLPVQFTDQSTGIPTAWHWDFGDNETSDVASPEHVFLQPGVYSVNLTVANLFGNATVEKTGLITVVDGTYHDFILPVDGINLTPEGDVIALTLDSSIAGNCSGDTETDPAVITCIPDEGTGIAFIRFQSPAGDRFSGPVNGTLSGILGDVSLTSKDFTPTNFSQKAGENCSFNFTLTPITYEPGASIRTVIWEGTTPDDLQKFDLIKIMYNYGNIDDLAYTVRFAGDNNASMGSANLTFGVSSDWVEKYGWRWNHEIVSEPLGAGVYIDSKFVGTTPLIIGDGLSPGNHTVTIVRIGYYSNITTITMDDKRDSIRVIRIADDGTGEVLNTTFVGHDPVRNLDLFRVESPNGFSTFGLASLSKSGSIPQLIQMIATRALGPGGGGGGGGSSDDSGSTHTQSSATATVTPAQTSAALPQATPPPQQQAPAPAPVTPVSVVTQQVMPEGTGEPVGQLSTGQQAASPLEFFTTGTTSIVILKNISIVFVVIFVTIVFYYRWRQKEE
ncbi:MAG: PKD domain-containing protein [Methanoregulaceae archaeon]|nr:PKD domain-containing protein [Methanoregulaceae archaeon]